MTLGADCEFPFQINLVRKNKALQGKRMPLSLLQKLEVWQTRPNTCLLCLVRGAKRDSKSGGIGSTPGGGICHA